QEAIDQAREHGITRVAQAFTSHFSLALVLYLWDDLDTAGRHLDRAWELARRSSYRRGRLLSGLLRPRVLSDGDPEQTDIALRQRAGLADARRSTTLPCRFEWLDTGLDARLRLARGDDPLDALTYLDGTPESPEAAVTAARLLLAADRPAEAL